MQMNEYQTLAASTGGYPGVGTGGIMALAYVGLGLGEAGEIQGKIKKILRDNGGHVSDDHRLALAKEAGDLLWYVSALTRELGMTLDQVARMNLAKLADRKERGVLGGDGDDR